MSLEILTQLIFFCLAPCRSLVLLLEVVFSGVCGNAPFSVLTVGIPGSGVIFNWSATGPVLHRHLFSDPVKVFLVLLLSCNFCLTCQIIKKSPLTSFRLLFHNSAYLMVFLFPLFFLSPIRFLVALRFEVPSVLYGLPGVICNPVFSFPFPIPKNIFMF